MTADDGRSEARARALASVLDAVGDQRGRSHDDVAALVDAEIAARNIEDVSTAERDLLIDAARSRPVTAGVRILARQTFGLVRWLKQNSQPRWTEAPRGITSLTSWRDDQEPIPVVLRTEGLDAEPAFVTRLFAELPGTVVTAEDEDGRPCDVWLADDGQSGGRIAVHIGQQRIATLPTEFDDTARALLAVHGGRSNAVEVLGELWGDEPSSGRLTIYLLSPP